MPQIQRPKHFERNLRCLERDEIFVYLSRVCGLRDLSEHQRDPVFHHGCEWRKHFGPPFLICGPGTCSCRALLILRNPSEDSLTRIEVPSSGAFDELTDLVKPEVRVDCECNCLEHFWSSLFDFQPGYIQPVVLCS
jgi:hypothetical protein